MRNTSKKEELTPSQRVHFFEDYEVFEKKRNKETSQGVNDYNIISSLLKPSDEVRVHSRFIYSMINPNSPHYQGTAYLECFLKVLGLENEFNLETTEGFLEYDNIDLYLTDGEKHLIVENKIHANDQKNQIKRYVETINKGENLHHDDIIVVYLTIGRRSPSVLSLGRGDNGYIIDPMGGKSYLKRKSDKKIAARYINMNYKALPGKASEMLNWVDLCKQRSENSPNLRHSLEQYEDIVHKVNKTYKSRVMSLEHFLTEDEDQSKNRIRQADEIYRKMPVVYSEWFNKAMTSEIEELLLPYEENENIVKLNHENCTFAKDYGYKKSVAEALFSRKQLKKHRNKGVFWAVTREDSSRTVALTMYLGKTHLHVGVLPVKKSKTGKYELCPEDIEHVRDRLKDKNRYEAHDGYREQKTLGPKLGLISWFKPLDEEVVHLHDFSESRQKEHLVELVKIFTV